jgi:hypothetical protein
VELQTRAVRAERMKGKASQLKRLRRKDKSVMIAMGFQMERHGKNEIYAHVGSHHTYSDE